MKKIYPMILMVGLFVLMAGVAEAGVWDKIKGAFGWQFWAYVATGAAFLASTFAAVIFGKSTTTMKESGEFLNVMAKALEDKKVTVEELKDIVKEGRDVINIWKTTPIKYQVK